MCRILVAVNGSLTSEKALEAAINLAQWNHARLAAVGVLDDAGDAPTASLMSAQALTRQMQLQSAADRAELRGLSLTAILRKGPAAETILECVDDEKADLLVLGTGSQNRNGRSLDSTAEQVNAHRHCALLLVNSGGWMHLYGKETPQCPKR